MDNINNILISKEEIEDMIRLYSGYKTKVKNVKSFQKAFIHKSFKNLDIGQDINDTNCNIFLDIGDNERLELLGDKVIGLISAEMIFDKYPNEPEGFLSDLNSRIICKKGLSNIANKLNFSKYLLISSHLERINGRTNISFLENTFEAFMGVLYKEFGLPLCKNFLLGVFDKHLDLEELSTKDENYKGILMRYFHSIQWGNPIYEIMYIDEASHRKVFIIGCFPGDERVVKEGISFDKIPSIYRDKIKTYGVCIGYGIGLSKKEATQKCAKMGLEYFGLIEDDE